MTIEALENQAQREELLQIVAQELPVFVLGPGCFRVGFDNPNDPNWREVERSVANVLARLDTAEQQFLKDFFFSKFSDERRTKRFRTQLGARLDRQVRIAQSPDAAVDDPNPGFDPWRSKLAARLLQAYRHASCCLGLTIGQGLHPVLQWQDAAVPADVIQDWFAGLDAEAPHYEAQNHFLLSRAAIQDAAHIAGAIAAVGRGTDPTDDQLGAVEDLADALTDDRRGAARLRATFDDPVKVLLPSAIAAKLEVLARQCFSADKPEPLRGANVEWLGDLLWHVLTGDARVQPAQADIAFYAALADSSASPTLRELKRPRYGDRHVTVRDVTRLTTHSQVADSGGAADRDEFLDTIARCLMAQHAMVTTRGTSTGDSVPMWMLDKVVIALVGDYGDLFERALFRLLGDERALHVCLPVWVTSENPKRIDWVVLDLTRTGDRADVSWRWLADAKAAGGPLVVKTSGCDRGPLDVPLPHGRVSDLAFAEQGPRWQERQAATIEAAVLYDEFDRLTAMQVFDELLNPGGRSSGLLSDLSAPGKGLTWPNRSWLFMGQTFVDWVPRLRLFTQMWAGSNAVRETPSQYWAIDRSFDWPERALLQSLGIKMVAGDLARVGESLDVRAFEGMPKTSIGGRFTKQFKNLDRG